MSNISNKIAGKINYFCVSAFIENKIDILKKIIGRK